MLCLAALLGVAGCGTSGAGHGDGASSTSGAGSSPETLKGAARALANAYLTGTPDAIADLQGPQCTTDTPRTPENRRLATAYLQRMRAALEKRIGVAPGAIKIRGVQVRNVTATSGEAEVEYDLPQSAAVGNYNWVTYELHAGKWKVADCHAPIGGNSGSPSFSPTTRRPAAQ